MTKITLGFRLNALYFFFYSGLACYFPFMTVYFHSRNLTYTQIGTAFAIQSLVSIIAQPVWGFVTDKYLNKRTTLMICLACCAVSIFMFVLAQSYFMAALAVAVVILFQSSITPISDSYCYEILETHPKLQFGKIRQIGSFSFAVVALILGKLISMTDIKTAFFAYALFFVSALLMLSGIKHKSKGSTSRPSFRDLSTALKNHKFIFFVFSVMILNISIGVHGSYIPILVEATGGNVSSIGLVWFVQAISEMPLFFLGSKLLKRFGELNIFLIASILYGLRFFLSSLFDSNAVVIALQLMQGLTYPLYFVSLLQYANRIVPTPVKATGVTILFSLGIGLGGFVGNLFGGALLEHTSIFVLYRIISAVVVVSVLISLLLKLKEIKEAKSSIPQ